MAVQFSILRAFFLDQFCVEDRQTDRHTGLKKLFAELNKHESSRSSEGTLKFNKHECATELVNPPFLRRCGYSTTVLLPMADICGYGEYLQN